MNDTANPEDSVPALDGPVPGTEQRRRWRALALLFGPTVALALLILAMWSGVAWFCLVQPRNIEAEHRLLLASAARTTAIQTESVLREAENGLRIVDLWVRQRGLGDARDDDVLRQVADSVRRTSGGLLDLGLVDRNGRLLPLLAPSSAPEDGASPAAPPTLPPGQQPPLVAKSPQAMGQGLSVGLPVHVGDRGPVRLPVLARLSRPVGDIDTAVALINLERLRDVQKLFIPTEDAGLALMRGDGTVLTRYPELPGLIGINIFSGRPELRAAFAQAQGFFSVDTGPGLLRTRRGAYVTLHDFAVKVLVTTPDDAALAQHHRRAVALATGAAMVTLLLLLFGRWLLSLQRAARLRAATLSATSNAVPLGLFLCDTTGRTIYANDTYLRLLGLGPESLAWGWAGTVPPDEREQAIQRWKQQMAAGRPFDLQRRLQRADDGRTRWFALRSAPLMVQGRVAGQAGTVEDVTERREQEQAHQTLAAVFEQTPDVVCQLREGGELVYLNPAARMALGLGPDEPVEGLQVSRVIGTEQLRTFREQILPLALEAGHWRGRGPACVGATTVQVEWLVIVHRDQRGRLELVSMILRDITEQIQAQRERERNHAMLLAVAHTANAQLLVLDNTRSVVFFNAAFEQHRGIRLDDWTGRPASELFGVQDFAARLPLITAALTGDTRRLTTAPTGDRGRSFDLQYAPLRVHSGQIEGVIGIEVDVTEARREEARLKRASQTDALTQLLNRAGFEDAAQRLLADTPSDQQVALLYIDLDKFKRVNDTHGHPTGDALLKAVAGRLTHTLRPTDLVARLGGDEFAVMLSGLHHAQYAEAVADKLVQALTTPFRIDTLTLQIGASIGFCTAPGQLASLDALVAQADAQLYEAKRAGRGCWRGAALQSG